VLRKNQGVNQGSEDLIKSTGMPFIFMHYLRHETKAPEHKQKYESTLTIKPVSVKLNG